MVRERGRTYYFGGFRLETDDLTLWHDGEKIPLPIKAVEVLTLLVEHRGRTVTKSELLETIWSETYVDENNLAVMVSALRKAFGEGKNENRFIETVPRRGYRFVHEIDEADGEIIIEKRTVTEITIDDGAPQLKTGRRFRFGTVAILAAVIAMITVAILFVAGGWRPWRIGGTESAAGSGMSLAVLPLKFLGENSKNDDYLSASLTESLTTRLARIRELNIRSAAAVADFAASSKSPAEIGRDLHVDSVLTGSFQRSGESIRINLQLVKVGDGSVVWSEKLDGNSLDIFKLQDSLAQTVADRLLLALSETQRAALGKKSTTDPEAERLYIEGRVHWNKRNVEGLTKSIELYESAVAKDPAYALAFAGMAESYLLLAEYKGMSTNEAYSKARINATKALELDPELAEAHNALAYVQSFFDWDWERGEASFKRAIEIAPNYATARHWYSELLNVRFRFDESWRELQRAHQLDPSSASIQSDIPHYYFIRRDYERSIEEAHKLIAKHPQFAYSYMYLYSSYEKLGREKEAAEALAKLHLYFGEDEMLVVERLKASESGGLKGFWQKALDQTFEGKIELKPEAIDFALAYLHAGDLDKTFAYLEKSLEERNRWFLEITYDPEWDAIRNDPRYDKLLAKAGLSRPQTSP